MAARSHRPTIRDVAREAGVSTTTVSDALNERGRIPEETREHVRAVAAKLDYHPRASARAFRTGRTGQIGLYSPVLDEIPGGLAGTGYYMELATGAARAALAGELALVLLPPSLPPAQLAAIDVDGVIVSDPARDDPGMAALTRAGFTVVTCERDPTAGSQHAGCVRSDHGKALRQLLAHLENQGAKRIALVAAGDQMAWSEEVTQSYRTWCAETGKEMIWAELPSSPRPEYAVAAALQVLEREPDAIVCAQDEGAAALVRALAEHDIAVPQDILVASCVDGTVVANATPSLTAIDLQPALAGHRAATLLAELLKGSVAPGADVVIPTRLIVRDSTQRPLM